MSDEPTSEAAESAETAQGAVETEAPESPPWGDDFSPERAWDTIQKQRAREKELEGDAKAWKRFREDDQFRQQAVSEFFEFAESTNDEDYEVDDDEDDERPLTRAEFDAFQQQQRIAESNRQFAQDLKELTSERQLKKQGKDWITSRYERGEFRTPDDVKTALDEWYAFEDELQETGKRSRSKPPSAPSSPGTGRAGEQEFDRKGATPSQRKAQREARIAAAVEASRQ